MAASDTGLAIPRPTKDLTDKWPGAGVDPAAHGGPPNAVGGGPQNPDARLSEGRLPGYVLTPDEL